MAAVIKSRIVKIGNSQGIRIPKLLLEQTSLEDEVELVLEEDQIIVRPAQRVRKGWDEAFKAMGKRADDGLLDAEAPVSNEWDEAEWEW
ncbi:MAG: AbrB/MazE/SpoVT family DNA-binding domain-containing protein [Anaerolineae bacterium]|jgi:antitoxin MazE|nr:AbrB/MazE/SpoVT family DNA-binding domain-containing protein [Anaerolineae bacterium]